MRRCIAIDSAVPFSGDGHPGIVSFVCAVRRCDQHTGVRGPVSACKDFFDSAQLQQRLGGSGNPAAGAARLHEEECGAVYFAEAGRPAGPAVSGVGVVVAQGV